MSPYFADIVGTAAAICTTLCWIPQTIHIIRTRDTRAISLLTQSAFAFGITLWFIYGVLIVSWPIIAANAVTLALVAAIIILKITHG